MWNKLWELSVPKGIRCSHWNPYEFDGPLRNSGIKRKIIRVYLEFHILVDETTSQKSNSTKDVTLEDSVSSY